MKLRWKILRPLSALIILALLILGTGLNYGLSTYLLQIEIKEHQERLGIVENMIASSLSSLEAWAFDIAHWDETVTFLKERNPSFLNSNFPLSAFESVEEWNSTAVVNLDTVAFVNDHGKILEYIRYDEDSKKRIIQPTSFFSDYVQKLTTQFQTDSDQDTLLTFARFDGRLFQLVLIPVKDSSSEETSDSYFLAMREWNDRELSQVKKLTGLDTRFASAEINSSSSLDSNIELSEDVITGKIDYADPFGEKLFQVNVSAPRTTFKLGQKSLKLFIGLILVFASMLLGTMVLIFESIVLRRISRLNTTVQKSKTENDQIDKIIDSGQDEIAQLSVDLHSLLNQMRSMAEVDPLTGLCNRRAFYGKVKKLTREITELKKTSLGYFSVVQFDIDKFKSINDTYGHPQGDEVIKAFAHTISGASNRNCCPARFGGEEFVIFLYTPTEKEAIEFAETVRLALEAKVIPRLDSPQENLKVTTSAGVFSTPVSHPVAIEEMLELSDKALYHSKNSGRNRTTLYSTLLKAS